MDKLWMSLLVLFSLKEILVLVAILVWPVWALVQWTHSKIRKTPDLQAGSPVDEPTHPAQSAGPMGKERFLGALSALLDEVHQRQNKPKEKP